ncbi:hypothetical protein ACHAWF_010485 [Thalassiosira exigua]
MEASSTVGAASPRRPRRRQRRAATRPSPRRRRPRAPSSLALAVAAAAVGLAVAPGSADRVAQARGEVGDSSSSSSSSPTSTTPLSWDPSSLRRRMRADAAVRDGMLNLIVKYKGEPLGTRRRLGNGSDDDWIARASSISTISEEGHIAAVAVDVGQIDYVLDGLATDGTIELVEEDFIVRDLPYVSMQQQPRRHLRRNQRDLTRQQNRTLIERDTYGVGLIKAPEVWELTNKRANQYTNTPVKVCIVDTGYDLGHIDLPNKRDGLTSTDTGYGNPYTDVDGHGTHCAGVIGALGGNNRGIRGINPNPNQFSFHISKALNDDGLGTASSVLVGIEGCRKSGSKIISMSLGGGKYSQIFRDMYKKAYDDGVLILAASGNLGLEQDDFPASYPEVISVGAVGPDGLRTNFSNWSYQLELIAPGVGIRSTYPGGAYGVFNQQVRNVLAATATSLSSSRGCTKKTGFGLVQAKAAFDALDRYGCAAGGEDLTKRSSGAVGGCGQPLADLGSLTPVSQESLVVDLCQKVYLKLLTDDYAYEISWRLVRADDGAVVNKGPPGGRNFADNTEYTGPASDCLTPGTYNFEILDLYGDGIAPPGYYSVSIGELNLKTNSNFGSKEVTSFAVTGSESATAWRSLVSEQFDTGFGSNFNDGGENVMWVEGKFGRSGLVMVKAGRLNRDLSSVSSANTQLDDPNKNTFQVKFSFYANNMDDYDSFCLDYSANGSSQWTREKCWRGGGYDFNNGSWYDDITREFQPEANTKREQGELMRSEEENRKKLRVHSDDELRRLEDETRKLREKQKRSPTIRGVTLEVSLYLEFEANIPAIESKSEAKPIIESKPATKRRIQPPLGEVLVTM